MEAFQKHGITTAMGFLYDVTFTLCNTVCCTLYVFALVWQEALEKCLQAEADGIRSIRGEDVLRCLMEETLANNREGAGIR